MPTAPIYGGQKVNEGVMPGVRANTNASAADYGGAVAEGMGRLGSGLQNLAEDIAREREAVARERKSIAAAKGAEAAQLYVAETSVSQDKYRTQNSGKLAVEKLPDYLKIDDETYSKHRDALASDEERKQFDDRVNAHRISLRGSAENYALDQGDKYKIESLESSAKMNQQTAAGFYAIGDEIGANVFLGLATRDLMESQQARQISPERAKLEQASFEAITRETAVSALIDAGKLEQAHAFATAEWVTSAPLDTLQRMRSTAMTLEHGLWAVDAANKVKPDSTGRLDPQAMAAEVSKLVDEKKLTPERAAQVMERAQSITRIKNAPIDAAAKEFMLSADAYVASEVEREEKAGRPANPREVLDKYILANPTQANTLTPEMLYNIRKAAGEPTDINININRMESAYSGRDPRAWEAFDKEMGDNPALKLGTKGANRLESLRESVQENGFKDAGPQIGQRLKNMWQVADLGKANDGDGRYQSALASAHEQIRFARADKGGDVGAEEERILQEVINNAKYKRKNATPYTDKELSPDNTAELGKRLYAPRPEQKVWLDANAATVHRSLRDRNPDARNRQYIGEYEATLARYLGIGGGTLSAERNKIMLERGWTRDQMEAVDKVLMETYKAPVTTTEQPTMIWQNDAPSAAPWMLGR